MTADTQVGRAGRPRGARLRARHAVRSAASAARAAVARLDAAGAVTMGLLLTLFLVAITFPTGLTANEENYFALAHRLVAPEAFPADSAVFDSARARYFSFWIVGRLVEAVGYETAHVVLRLVQAALYGGALAVLFRSLGLGPIDGVLVLALFVTVGQHTVGKEWLFGGVEAKTFAYAGAMVALGLAIRGRLPAAAAVGALATWAHFLVGGFWMAAALAIAVLLSGQMRPSLRALGLYVAMIAPLLGLIVADRIDFAAPAAADGPTADYIYSILRNDHHVSPFQNRDQLIGLAHDLSATAAALVGFALLALMSRGRTAVLAGVAALLFLYVMLAVGVSWLDRSTGVLGKFYLLRPSALALLFGLAVAAVPLRRAGLTALRAGAAAALVAAMLPVTLAETAAALVEPTPPRIAEARALVERHTRPGEAVLIEPYDAMTLGAALPRAIDRPTVVSWKFVPTTGVEILEWYRRHEALEALLDGDCAAAAAELGSPRWLLVFTQAAKDGVADCARPVEAGSAVVLMRLSGR